MSQFFIIDHSLRDTGGHHFDYVRGVAEAARQASFDVTIGCHQDWAAAKNRDAMLQRSLESFGHVRPVFHQTVYQGDSWLAGLRDSQRAEPLPMTIGQHAASGSPRRLKIVPQSIRQSFRETRNLQRRARLAARFAQDCETFFRNSEVLRPGDQVLIAAASELELEGLARFLKSQPAAGVADWHLLFHFNLFAGRSPEYAAQSAALIRTRAAIKRSMQQLQGVSVQLHTTTETLADQFNELRIVRFKPIAYPISNDFLPSARRLPAATESVDQPHDGPTKPLRLVCAGAVRREKGQVAQLQNLVTEIEDGWLQAGKVQLVIQRPRRRWPARQKIELTVHGSSTEREASPIEYVNHPLPRNEYLRLIQSADVGLFCYDARTYFSRCAGILVEMLASGKPVIVPAGSWLADQIQPLIQDHVRQVLGSQPLQRMLEHADLKVDSSNLPMPGGVWSFDRQSHPFVASANCQPDETIAVAQFDWHRPQTVGTYCRLECLQFDSDDQPIDRAAQTLGIDRQTLACRAMFLLKPEAHRFEFRLTNAFDDATATIRNFSVSLLAATDESVAQMPIGAVGVIAAEPSTLADCVAEVATWHDHYRRSAQAFAETWVHRHHPRRTIECLTEKSASLRRAA